MANSFFGYLTTDQINTFIAQAQQELENRGEIHSKLFWQTEHDKRKRAERYGVPFFGEELGRPLFASRKVKADIRFDDTKVIRRNKAQRAEFVEFLDWELDEYARERDRIISQREDEEGKWL